MPNKLDFNHPTHKLWVLLDQTYVAVSKCQEAVFAKAGLTLQQYRVLMVIDFAKYPVTPTDVARWLDRNTNSISLIIDRMEKIDLVERVRDLKDRRALRLAITPKGKELFKRATAHGLELMKTMMSCCSEEEIQSLTHLLGKLRGRVLEELIPEGAAREAKINGSKDIARFMAKPGKTKSRKVFRG
jgi:DNA-binding MarR family transcriptional regulator